MKKLDRLLTTSFVPPFVLAFLIAVFVLLMQTLWLYIDDLAGKGLGIFLVIELLAYKCVALFPLALPIAVLISSVMVLGNLAENYELSSFKSAGVPLIRIMRPMLAIGALTAIFSYYVSNNLIPVANLKFGSRMYDIQRQKPALRLDTGVFNYDFQGYVIHIGKKEKDGRRIEDILIYDHSDNNANEFSQIVAEKGEMFATADGTYFVMNLKNGNQYIETRPGQSGGARYPFVRTAFQNWTKIFDLSEFSLSRTDEELFKSNRSMLTIDQLYDAVDSMDVKILEREKAFSNTVSNYFHILEPDSTMLRPETPDTLPLSAAPAPRDTSSPPAGTIRIDSTLPTDLPGGLAPAPALQVPPAARPRIREYGLVADLPPVDLDTVTRFASVIRAMPEYEGKRLYSKAATYARSIKNQAEGAMAFLDDLRENRVKHIYDLHMKYSMALVCLVFVFIGAPMGAIVRKGGFGYPILISIIFFMLFVILTIFCRKIAESLVLPPVPAAWTPNGILLPVGLLLTYKAMNDSKLFNLDRYQDFFTRILQKLNRRP